MVQKKERKVVNFIHQELITNMHKHVFAIIQQNTVMLTSNKAS